MTSACWLACSLCFEGWELLEHMHRSRERLQVWKEEGELMEQHPRAAWVGNRARLRLEVARLESAPALRHCRRAAEGAQGEQAGR